MSSDASQNFSHADISYHKINLFAYLRGFPVISKKVCN